MKTLGRLAACAGGFVSGTLLAGILSITTDPSKMQYGDHDFACRLIPVLGVLVVTTIAAYCRQSRALFAVALTGVPMSLLVPEPDRGHALIRGMERVWIYSLKATFIHSTFVASIFGFAAVAIATLAWRRFPKLRPNVQ